MMEVKPMDVESVDTISYKTNQCTGCEHGKKISGELFGIAA
jgi:hypothetical protein